MVALIDKNAPKSNFVEPKIFDESKLGHDCEMAWWNCLTCLVGPQSSASLDWGPSILNRSEGLLGPHFVTQLKGYQNFDLMIFLYGRWPTQEKTTQIGLGRTLRLNKSFMVSLNMSISVVC